MLEIKLLTLTLTLIYKFLLFRNLPFNFSMIYIMIYFFPFFVFVFFMFHSKKKNQQWIFPIWSLTEEASQKEGNRNNLKICKNWWNRWTMISFRQFCYIFDFFLTVWVIIFYLLSMMSYMHIVWNELWQDSYTTHTGREQFLTIISGNLLSIDHEIQTK